MSQLEFARQKLRAAMTEGAILIRRRDHGNDDIGRRDTAVLRKALAKQTVKRLPGLARTRARRDLHKRAIA